MWTVHWALAKESRSRHTILRIKNCHIEHISNLSFAGHNWPTLNPENQWTVLPHVASPFLEHHSIGEGGFCVLFLWPYGATWEFATAGPLTVPYFSFLLSPPTGHITLSFHLTLMNIWIASSFLKIINKTCIEICGLISLEGMFLFCWNKFCSVELLV